MPADPHTTLDRSLYHLFDEQAARSPDAVAVIDHHPVTYAELAARAEAIAELLVARGVQPEEPVGVSMPRDAQLVAALLGVLKAGCAYVPLELDDPPERRRTMVRAAGCRLVLGNADDLGDGVEPLDVASLRAPRTAGAPTAPGGDRLAYVLFTSGSTGAPKGVEVQHRGVVNLVLAARDLLGFGPDDRYLATSIIGFDISVAEVFLPLVTGGSLVLRDRQLLLEPARLAGEIARHAVTFFQTGPSLWELLLTEVAEFPRLRVAIATGEAISPATASLVAGHADAAWNLYGPTEATVWATGHRLDAALPPVALHGAGSPVSAPIGRPLANVVALVVGDQGDEQPSGVEGELWLGGAAVARGYRGRPDLTAARFVTRAADGERYYRTGDRALADADGVLHYLGRNDDQLKINGVRIEPREVEAALLSAPHVAQAAATWFEHANGNRSIVAAIVTHPGLHLSSRQLREHAATLLPAAMLPSRFVAMTTLPLTTSGKVDRAAIRSLAAQHLGPPIEGAGGRPTATEQQVIDIWERTLGITGIGRHDHFFTIGGDSLAAVTMMLDVEDAFAVSLPVRVAFEAPTVEQLATRVERSQRQPDDLGQSDFVFPLVDEGEGPALFFCSVELQLARRGMWTAGCPLYAVAQWAQGSGFATGDSMADLARLHLDAIRALQPYGPYRIAGYSFGGLVALELAHQLRAAGDTVELLFLLDPMQPYRYADDVDAHAALAPPPAPRERTLARVRRHLRAVVAEPSRARRYVTTRARLHGRAFPVWQWINYRLVSLHATHPNAMTTRLLPKDRWPAFWYTGRRLATQYAVRRYDGPALVVFLDHGERHDAWQPVLGAAATVRTIDTTHSALFSGPALRLWTAALRECLGLDEPA